MEIYPIKKENKNEFRKKKRFVHILVKIMTRLEFSKMDQLSSNFF